MKCPQCTDQSLLMSERQGVEIDYCPQCRGVWLDRGELDKLIERSLAINAVPASPPAPQAQAYPQPQPYPPGGSYKHHGHRKHKSWLHEIFD
jgi:uncharacterized protein